MSALLKPTITYKLADLLAYAASKKAEHDAEVAKLADQNQHGLHALTEGYHTTMAQASQRVIDKLEEFRAAGVETVTAEYQIDSRPLGGAYVDTTLSSQLSRKQIRPVA